MIMVGRSLVCGRVEELRAQFPVLERVAYLNAGTNGPVPRGALEAAERVAARAGRAGPQQQAVVRAPDRAHRRAARARGARCSERRPPRWRSPARRPTASTPCSPRVDIQPGDEILTSDEEHPGVLGPIATARDTRGATVRVVPFADLPDEVRAGHAPRRDLARVVGHRQGDGHGAARGRRRARRARRRAGPRRGPGGRARARLRLLRRLGPEVAVRPGRHRLPVRQPGAACPTCPRPGAATTPWRTAERALEPALQPDARRLATGFPVPHHVEWAHAVSRRARGGRPRRRCTTAPSTGAEPAGQAAGGTAVSRWRRGATRRWSPSRCRTPRRSPQAAAAEGIVIRGLPGTPYVRASVGAWNSDEELERLVRSWPARGAASR